MARLVTVFGGSGFIGRHLVRRLAAQGLRVRVAVRDAEQALFLKTDGNLGQISLMSCSVMSPESVARAVDGADVVVNLVGILYERGRRSFQKMHVEAAETIAKAAAKAGASQLVHLSALGASVEAKARYAKTKAEGEAAVQKAFPSAVILRPSVVFGPEDDFFNQFAGMTRFSPMLPVFGCPLIPKVDFPVEDGLIKIDLYGDGGTKFQPVFVGDVAQAIMNAIDNPKAQGKTFELGGPRVFSFKEIQELVLKHTGRKRFLAPIPFAVGRLMATFLQFLPKPLLTPDQVELLKTDNVVSETAATIRDLGIEPTSVEAVLPTYLARFKPVALQRVRSA